MITNTEFMLVFIVDQGRGMLLGCIGERHVKGRDMAMCLETQITFATDLDLVNMTIPGQSDIAE